MNAPISARRALVLGAVLMLLGSIFTGCKSTPKIDWNSRIGTYTYDDAVMELGPPDKYTTLTDGKIVADWIKVTGSSSVSFGFGTSFYGGPAVGVGQTYGSGYNQRILRLTFGQDFKLVSWWKNY
jgi:uncharacterized membrane protein YedE/YeeE